MTTNDKANKALAPKCPQCGGEMKLRRGGRGEFWGCGSFPKCRGTARAERAAGTGRTKIPFGSRGSSGSNSSSSSGSSSSRTKGGSGLLGSALKQIERVDSLKLEIMPGSPEQEAIWAAMLESSAHVTVEAVAGSGKTWTMIQGCLRAPKHWRIGYIAFNKHNAREAQEKLEASGCSQVDARTYHSLGLVAYRAGIYGRPYISDWKMWDLLKEMGVEERWKAQGADGLARARKLMGVVSRMVDIVKNNLLPVSAGDFSAEKMRELCDYYGVEGGDGDWAIVEGLRLLPELMERSFRQIDRCDYGDMVYMPVVRRDQIRHAIRPYDLLIVDEAQDTNLAQQELALMYGKRVVIVGDRHQAIYGFRGADMQAIPRLTERLRQTGRVEVLGLPVTRRCPLANVRMAQVLVPQIREIEGAPAGEVKFERDVESAAQQMKPGDLGLCRVNKALIPAAYALIRRGVPVVIRGRDIGEGLIKLIGEFQQQGANTVEKFLEHLGVYYSGESRKLLKLGEKGEMRLVALQDRCDCLRELAIQHESIEEMLQSIVKLFADFDVEGRPQDKVVLGTVHRTKGLESSRVWVLESQLIPHPMAKQGWEHEQEKNLAYVAVTRTKFDKEKGVEGETIFVGEALPGFWGEGVLVENERGEGEGAEAELGGALKKALAKPANSTKGKVKRGARATKGRT